MALCLLHLCPPDYQKAMSLLCTKMIFKENWILLLLATVVEGEPKTPFSMATTPSCKGGCYFFPRIAQLTLDVYLIMLNVKQGGIKYHFWVFGMTRPGIEPRSPGSFSPNWGSKKRNKKESMICLTAKSSQNFFVHGIQSKEIFFLQKKGLFKEKGEWRIKQNHHHHHDVMPPARISPTLSRHFSLSFIVSSQSCWMYVQAGRPAFAWSYVGVHRSTSLVSSSLLLQQCPACLVCLTLIVFVIGGRWPYSWCFVGCCRQDLFNIACSILV